MPYHTTTSIKFKLAGALQLMAVLLCQSLAAESKLVEKIRAAESNWINAVKAGDKDSLEKILSPDLVYTHSTGVVENRQEYISSLTDSTQKYASIEYESPLIRTYKEAAVLTGVVHMTGSRKGVPFDNRLRLLHVWIQKPSGWELVAHQTTRIQQP